MFLENQVKAAVDLYVDEILMLRPSIKIMHPNQARTFLRSSDPDIREQVVTQGHLNEEAKQAHAHFSQQLPPEMIDDFKRILSEKLWGYLQSTPRGLRTDKSGYPTLKLSAGKSGLMSDASSDVKALVQEALQDSGLHDALNKFRDEMRISAAQNRLTFAPYETPFPSLRVDLHGDGTITHMDQQVAYEGCPELPRIDVKEVSLKNLPFDQSVNVQDGKIYVFQRLDEEKHAQSIMAVENGVLQENVIDLTSKFAIKSAQYEEDKEYDPDAKLDGVIALIYVDRSLLESGAINPANLTSNDPEAVRALPERKHITFTDEYDLGLYYLSRDWKIVAGSEKTDERGLVHGAVEKVPVRYVRLTKGIFLGAGSHRFVANAGDWVGVTLNGVGDPVFDKINPEEMAQIQAGSSNNYRVVPGI